MNYPQNAIPCGRSPFSITRVSGRTQCWQRIMVFKRKFWTSHKIVPHSFNLHLDAAEISYGSKSKLSLQFQSKFPFSCDVYYSSYIMPLHGEEIFKNSVCALPSLPEVWLGEGYSAFCKITLNYSFAFKEQFWMNNFGGSGSGLKCQMVLLPIFIPAV